MTTKILLIAASQFGGALLLATLEEADYKVHWVPNLDSARQLVNEQDYQAALLDLTDIRKAPSSQIEQLAQALENKPLITINARRKSAPTCSTHAIERPYATSELITTLRHALNDVEASAQGDRRESTPTVET